MAKGKIKVINVLPLNDTEEHEKTETCKCNPRVESVGTSGKAIVHKFFDGRECCTIDVKDDRWASDIDFLTV